MAVSIPDSQAPNRQRWGMYTPGGLQITPYSTKTFETPGRRWITELEWSRRDYDGSADLEALLVQIKGQAGEFTCPNWMHASPRGTASGNPVAASLTSYGVSLPTSGWGASETVLMAGDCFTINGEFKMVTEDVESDENGLATVSFEPALYTAVQAGTALLTSRPVCTFRMLQDEVRVTFDEGGMVSIKIKGVES